MNIRKRSGKPIHLAIFILLLSTWISVEHADAEMNSGTVFKDCPDCPEMVVLPAGAFDMGGAESDNEMPLHHVTIGRAFAIGKTEITQGQWKMVMGNNPSGFFECGDDCPVEKVSWNDVQVFIQKFNAKTGKKYRLPSEAEWEYACRGGSWQEYCGSDDLNSIGWYGAYSRPAGNSGKYPNQVGRKQANGYGLYDMTGNVFEWVEDSYHENYNGAPTNGSVWQGDGEMRVYRGGAWGSTANFVRAAFRFGDKPSIRSAGTGFRLAKSLP